MILGDAGQSTNADTATTVGCYQTTTTCSGLPGTGSKNGFLYVIGFGTYFRVQVFLNVNTPTSIYYRYSWSTSSFDWQSWVVLAGVSA